MFDRKIDAIIIIASFDRYNWLYQLLTNLNNQVSNYSYKIIVLDDGSSDKRYSNLKNIFKIQYIKNRKNQGKCSYWQTITSILTEVKKYNFEYLIQIDDDFDICDNFINVLLDEHIKQNNAIATVYSRNTQEKRWGYSDFIDGGFVCNKKLLELINYTIPKRKCSSDIGSRVWQYITTIINKNKFKIHLHPEILVTHLGYKDSKMNQEIRIKKNIVINKTL